MTARCFYEFFAGGGMARAGLGAGWRCLFANDIDTVKAAAYEANWGASDLRRGDIGDVRAAHLPGLADLAWASFPCQDLSLAGHGLGLGSETTESRTRSGSFWAFTRIMRELVDDQRAPGTIVLENVVGLLTGNEGRDFATVGRALADLGYRFGAVVLDASHFVPQSRPRVFVVAVRRFGRIPAELRVEGPVQPWHPDVLVRAVRGLDRRTAERWIWWNPGPAPVRSTALADLISDKPYGVSWNLQDETAKLIGMMSDRNLERLEAAKLSGRRMVGSLHLRTRATPIGRKLRAEINFEPTAGCLRTPKGGCSRARVIVVEGRRVRTRLLSPEEGGRLMGLPDDYRLPDHYELAFQVLGDGLAVPAVAFLRERILDRIDLPARWRRDAAWTRYRAVEPFCPTMSKAA
ncbi:DNA cytosine methyltransferase [Methylobacterium radiotolerans]|uniref:DNA cytosine methyltransferase n=1 Tax=Methylobacterium radiotolerans TaxID=31998 RepID=UPI0038D08D1A